MAVGYCLVDDPQGYFQSSRFAYTIVTSIRSSYHAFSLLLFQRIRWIAKVAVDGGVWRAQQRQRSRSSLNAFRVSLARRGQVVAGAGFVRVRIASACGNDDGRTQMHLKEISSPLLMSGRRVIRFDGRLRSAPCARFLRAAFSASIDLANILPHPKTRIQLHTNIEIPCSNASSIICRCAARCASYIIA